MLSNTAIMIINIIYKNLMLTKQTFLVIEEMKKKFKKSLFTALQTNKNILASDKTDDTHLLPGTDAYTCLSS